MRKIIFLIATLATLQVYVLQFNWWLAIAYSITTIIFPLFIILIKLKNSVTPKDFHRLSTITKLVMFTGIVSMVFFYFYL